MNFLPLTSILLATLIINNAIRRSNRIDEEKRRQYLEREKKAARTPSKNLDKILWISVPSSLPLDLLPGNERASGISQTIKKLSEKKITNLNGYTNTDLKLEFGAVNLSKLSAADANCIVLLRSLSELADIYLDNGLRDEAMKLLQFALSSGSDDPKHFEILADYYLEKNDPDAIHSLIEYADEIDSDRGEKISARLKQTALLMEEVVGNEQTSEGNT